jgi:hypothetical protein
VRLCRVLAESRRGLAVHAGSLVRGFAVSRGEVGSRCRCPLVRTEVLRFRGPAHLEGFTRRSSSLSRCSSVWRRSPEWGRMIARTAAGTASKSPFAQTTKARSVNVKLNRKVLYELDGTRSRRRSWPPRPPTTRRPRPPWRRSGPPTRCSPCPAAISIWPETSRPRGGASARSTSSETRRSSSPARSAASNCVLRTRTAATGGRCCRWS